MLDMNWVRNQMNHSSAQQRTISVWANRNVNSARGSKRFLVGLAIGLVLSLGTGLAIAKQVLRPFPVRA
jgi:hypothetical protein